MLDQKVYFIRIGSNSEKEIINKTISLFSGLIARANLFESSPGMLSSMFINISSGKLNQSYIIDPVTYVFALDPYNPGAIRSWQKVNKDTAIQKLKEDLKIADEKFIDKKWIREIENPTKVQENKVEVLGIKKAYRKLADSIFPEALANFIGLRSIRPEDLTKEVVKELVKNIISYQNNAITNSKYNIDKYTDFKNEIPKPSYILSPYFNIIDEFWYKITKDIWNEFNKQLDDSSAAIVLHTNIDFLSTHKSSIIEELQKLGTKNIFLWLNDFEEEKANFNHILLYAELIKELNSSGKNVINLYSGGFSSFLLPFGLKGLTNGPGYGMDKDSEPVVGGIPTAQYYIPSLHIRLTIVDAYNKIQENNLGKDKISFHKEICNCPICQKGIREGASDMIFYFGELGEPLTGKDGIDRSYPTSEAMEKCRFHFIFSRLIEYRWAKNTTKENAIIKLNEEIKLWENNGKHLSLWKNALTKIS